MGGAAGREVVMRHLGGLLCVCALGLMPLVGCETADDGGTGGTAGGGGTDACVGPLCDAPEPEMACNALIDECIMTEEIDLTPEQCGSIANEFFCEEGAGGTGGAGGTAGGGGTGGAGGTAGGGGTGGTGGGTDVLCERELCRDPGIAKECSRFVFLCIKLDLGASEEDCVLFADLYFCGINL